jgi:CheY-like chemotaxis protein
MPMTQFKITLMTTTQFSQPLNISTVDNMSKSTSSTPSDAVPKKRILVIDDEPEVRRVIQYCLEDLAGWETVAVGSGQEGLVLVMTQPFDAIILDWMMPGMDGLMFLKALRAYPDAPDILVILLTAKLQVSLDDCVDFDVAGVIEKPFDPIQLPIQVAQLLNWMPIEY